MKTLFVVAALLMLLLGVVWTLWPQPVLSSWGVQANDVTVYIARRYGSQFFGYAVILWMSRATESSAARSAILAGGAVVTSVIAIVSVVGIMIGVVGFSIWSAALIEVLLAVGFLYFYVTAR